MTKTKIICNSCMELKKEYYPGAGICEDCAKKMDEHIENTQPSYKGDDKLNNGGKS